MSRPSSSQRWTTTDVVVSVVVKTPRAIFAPGRSGWSGVVGRGGVEPPTFRFSGGRSYRLSYLPWMGRAVLTGLEPATSALTGRRALQLLHRTWSGRPGRAPNGIRTRATALKGRRPGPLDDGGDVVARQCSHRAVGWVRRGGGRCGRRWRRRGGSLVGGGRCRARSAWARSVVRQVLTVYGE